MPLTNGMAKRVMVLAATAVAAFVLTTGTAGAAGFSAHGSAKQVYATGLTPGGKVALVNASGKSVQTRKAGALGGALFRGVKPGTGYRVRAAGEASDPLTVLSDDATPPTPDVYNQTLPSSGYGYLTTRDGT